MSGLLEIVLIVAIVLVVFGAGKLPAAGQALGRMVRNFKNAQASRDEIEVTREEQPRVQDSAKH